MDTFDDPNAGHYGTPAHSQQYFGPGNVVWPNPWPQTVTHTPPQSYSCKCGRAIAVESVVLKKKELADGSEVVSDTRQALVCSKCGVIAWIGQPAPKTLKAAE